MTDFLKKLFDEIQAEARANPDFYNRLRLAVGSTERVPRAPHRHRRPTGVLDPMKLMREGEDALRTRLSALTVDQLKDIVAEHGMDTTKLAMKWRTPQRLIELIVSTVRGRLAKGTAFGPQREIPSPPDD